MPKTMPQNGTVGRPHPSARLAALQRKANAHNTPMQRVEEEDLLQGKLAQRAALDEEEALQGKALGSAERSAPMQAKPGDGALPEDLKAGVESLSGVSMDGVRVHRNSSAPASVGAHAYAQGRDIHLGPGQERHLPHEAWHVAQQAQGRVKPTRQLAGVAVNDDVGLETEADVMGAKAMQFRAVNRASNSPLSNFANPVDTIQMTRWKFYSGVWHMYPADQVDDGDMPTQPGKEGEYRGELHEQPTGGDYDDVETLPNGTEIDWPALTAVLDGYDLGTGAETVSVNAWKEMRKRCSEAITLANKSHPNHGSNFDKKQKPVQQIKDWADPIQGDLKVKLSTYFLSEYGVYL